MIRRGIAGMVCITGLCAFAQSVVFEPGNTDVVIEKGAQPVVGFAAVEATNFLSRVLGAPVPIVDAPREGRAALVLGMNRWSRKAGIDPDAKPRDTFFIRTAKNRVYVAGRDSSRVKPMNAFFMEWERGTLFGVYAFLEDYAGCRFYFPGELGEVVPKAGSITVPETDRAVTPDMSQRVWYWDRAEMYDDGSGEKFDDLSVNRITRLHWLRTRAASWCIKCCHGINSMGFEKKFAQSHPEYFALMEDGTRCTGDPRAANVVKRRAHLCFSNPGVREAILDFCVKQIEKGAKYVDIMPHDGMQLCHCEKCEASYAEAGKKYGRNIMTDLVWGYTKWVGEKLIERGAAGFVTQMAYDRYSAVPDFALPTNVYVMIAVNGPRNKPEKWQKQFEVIRRWKKASANPVWIWTYPGKFLHYARKTAGVPNMMPRATGEYYKALAGDVIGTFAQYNCEVLDKWIFNYLNYCVLTRVMWDTRTDVAAYIDEHHRLMFGAGAAPMAQFYGMLEYKWIAESRGIVKDTELGPVETPPTDEELWSKVYGPDVLAKMDGLLRKAAATVPPDSIEARRIAFFRREFYDSLAEVSGRYTKKKAGVAALRWNAGTEKQIALVPFNGGKAAPAVKTAVRIERTDESVVVRFGCEEPHMVDAECKVRERDNPEMCEDSCIEIFLNPSADRKNYYHVAVNMNGDVADWRCARRVGGGQDEDLKWNSDSKVEIKRREDGWSATVSIPVTSLGEMKDAFPMEFARNRAVKPGEGSSLYHWSPYATGFHDIANWGTVEFK